MRSRFLARLAIGLLLGLAWGWLSPPVSAQPAKPEPVSFKTKDQVEIQGRFYPSSRGRDAHCVLLLHAIHGDTKQSGWDTLATELQKEEFAVLTFDFRGHGDSKTVGVGSPAGLGVPAKPGFWDILINRQLATRRFNPAQPPRSIDAQDFDRSYYPMLFNDIAAAKLFLDARNDAEKCNSSRLIVIGAQEGAALGMMWMVLECQRYKLVSSFPPRTSTDAEGEGLIGAVWLSMTPTLGNRPLPVSQWLQLLGHKNGIPMGFLYGERDQTSANFSKRCVEILKSNKTGQNTLNAEKAIKGTDLKGHGLLNKQLDTTTSIVEYLKKVRDERRGPAWKAKKPNETAYVWMIGGRYVPAKAEREEVMELLFPEQLLR
ncbi:MAG TPA: hypothetical protein VNK04_24800 [Gemmataceae bacterium]|nr:hypothetical protein [Gemmataceae bacterium]